MSIGDQPIFMDGSYIISTEGDTLSFEASMVGDPELSFVEYAGLVQRIPTGKKFVISDLTYPNADGPDAELADGLEVFLINEYQGYDEPTIKIALTLQDALDNIPYYNPTVVMNMTLTDDEPAAKYTKWGIFLEYVGETLDVIADGVLYEALVVDADGFITLPIAVSKIVAGYYFQADLETVTPDSAGSFGSAQGSMKRVDRAYVRYHQSRCGKIGSEEANLEPIVFPTDLPYSGGMRHEGIGSPEVEFKMVIRKDKSLPLNVMSITLRGQANE